VLALDLGSYSHENEQQREAISEEGTTVKKRQSWLRKRVTGALTLDGSKRDEPSLDFFIPNLKEQPFSAGSEAV